MSKQTIPLVIFLISLFTLASTASPVDVTFYQSNSCSAPSLAVVNLESQVGDNEKLIRQNLQQCSDANVSLLKAGVKDRNVSSYSVNGKCNVMQKSENLGSFCIGLAGFPEAYGISSVAASVVTTPSGCNPNDIIFTEEVEAPRPVAGKLQQVLNSKYCRMAANDFNAISASPGGYMLFASCAENSLTVRAVVTNSSRPGALLSLSADYFAQIGSMLQSSCGIISVQVVSRSTNTASVYIYPTGNSTTSP